MAPSIPWGRVPHSGFPLRRADPGKNALMPGLRIFLLNSPRLVVPDGVEHPLERKDAALLALLAMEGPTPRAKVAALLARHVRAAGSHQPAPAAVKAATKAVAADAKADKVKVEANAEKAVAKAGTAAVKAEGFFLSGEPRQL